MKKRPAIIILHGWGMSGARFHALSDAFVKLGYEVYSPDMPGFGNSRQPTVPLTLSDYGDYLKKYIAANGLERPVLVCHSFGGRVALNCLHRNPGLVRGVIFSGTPGFSSVPKAKFRIFVMLAKMGNIAMSLPVISAWKDSVRRWYYYFVGARDFYRANPVMRETFKLVVNEDLTAYMESLRVPTLLIWGEDDRLVPLAVARRMRETIPGARLEVFPGYDHVVPIAAAERFAASADRFISAL